jgi:hypothetical protein
MDYTYCKHATDISNEKVRERRNSARISIYPIKKYNKNTVDQFKNENKIKRSNQLIRASLSISAALIKPQTGHLVFE